MDNILFFTEIGKKIGLGHFSRCLALSQAFSELGYKSKFYINNIDQIPFSPAIDFCFLDWSDHNKFEKLNLKNNVVIFDSYLTNFKSFFSNLPALYNKVFIADSQLNYYPKGIVVVASVFANDLMLPDIEKGFYLKGEKYILLRDVFWDVPEYSMKANIQNILISLGSNDIHNLVPQIYEFISEHSNYNIRIVGNTKIQPGRNVTIETGISAKEMLNRMLKSDLLICNGGQTLLESVRIGLPSISIGISENQKRNIIWWHNKGIVKNAGWFNEIDVLKNNIVKYIDYLTPVNERLRINDHGKKIIDGQGARRCVSEILNYLSI